MTSKNKFGQLLKEQRQAHGLTQRALAAQLGIKASHVAYLEGGQRNPSLALLGRIADTLRLDRKRLFVLAHPEAKAMMPASKPVRPASPAEAWRKLLSDRALLSRYQVTRHELRALKQLSMLGYAMSPREFVAIVTLIRRDPQEE
ncbi:MAG: helix-turn-helix domain-containing protein [Candidatus Binataceae bacterium]